MDPAVQSAKDYISSGKLEDKMLEGMSKESGSTSNGEALASSALTFKRFDEGGNAVVPCVGSVVLIQPEDREAEAVFARVIESEERPSNLFAGGPSSKRRKVNELFYRVKYFAPPRVCEGPLVALRDRRMGKKRRNPSASAASDADPLDCWIPARWIRMRLEVGEGTE